MISENDEVQRERDRANLAWSILWSLPVTVAFWFFLTGVLAVHPGALLKFLMPRTEPTPEMVVMSTAKIDLERRPVPQPPQRVTQQQTPQQQRQPAPKAEEKAPPTPQAQPTELSRLEPSAPPQPSSAPKKTRQATLAEQLAQQQVAFQHEADQLNAQRAPLSAATIDPNQRASSQQPFEMDIPGLPGEPRRGEGIIEPSDMERVRGYDCYTGGTYRLRYFDGKYETGSIPWPFCYPPRLDPFLQRYRRFAMPLPLPGYRLPPGIQLQPAAKETYDEWLSEQS